MTVSYTEDGEATGCLFVAAAVDDDDVFGGGGGNGGSGANMQLDHTAFNDSTP